MKGYFNKGCCIRPRLLFFASFVLSLLSYSQSAGADESAVSKNTAPPVFTYKIVKEYPHDPRAFVQGLCYEDDGVLYEGTGLLGQSSLRKVKLETGDVLKIRWLPPEFFGEGVTVFGDKIIQLTWRNHKGFVYDKESFRSLREFHYRTEGWGLTHDGKNLIMSDGTENLYFLDPETFEEVGRIKAHDNYGLVPKLNELEYIHGEIFANVWLTNRIARISPQTGRVTGWLELKGLAPYKDGEAEKALNGIAYDPQNDRLFVTGKLWPKLYEIKLVPLD
ncbi:MAG: glutaminyl-peptide cyclotransferase [Nitrospirae bacterium]|nr:glutaminyl-peptide cyclotransferase [Nitrospirota bacterium]